MDQERLLSCALDVGEQMLISGAEVGRVEAAIRFICNAYGCLRTDVFTITSSIVVTVYFPDGKHRTQTRRITGSRTDLTRLHRLNDLSREICYKLPSYEYIQDKLKKICAWPPYPLWLEALGSALIAFSFAIFFGGNVLDGVVACLLGVGIRYLTFVLQKAELNQIFVNVVASFFLCLSAISFVRRGFGCDVNKIIIGNIMLLIPGIAFTTSLRDIINGDTISGLIGISEAAIKAIAIAIGFALVLVQMGGAL